MRVRSTLTTSSHALLGLLSIAPMSGYDLHQAVQRSAGRFWPISKSQVYAELARLEPLGLIRGREVRQERLPDKRVFELTEAGEDALDRWLDDGPLEDPQFRLPLLLKVLFGHRRVPGDTGALLRDVQDEAAARAGLYREFLDLLSTVGDTEYARITVLHALRVAEAEAGWAREAQRLLPERTHRIADPSVLDAEITRLRRISRQDEVAQQPGRR